MSELDWWNPEAPAMTPAERRKMKRRASTQPKGHAWKPGTGPEGETCGTCRHIFRNQMAKTYLKCGLMRDRWTGGAGTDIRSRDPACAKWEASHGG